MAKKRKASVETKAKRFIGKTLPVVAGFGVAGLGIYYFGNQPVIDKIASGLQGQVKSSGSSWFSGWF